MRKEENERTATPLRPYSRGDTEFTPAGCSRRRLEEKNPEPVGDAEARLRVPAALLKWSCRN
ncbi:MAG: hypothetical protein AAGD07_23945, partial [Planctomycetota bacterium]